jgi:hypothetical protein
LTGERNQGSDQYHDEDGNENFHKGLQPGPGGRGHPFTVCQLGGAS